MSAALEGQVALVTGGGSGIGLGCARALVADGATVVLAGRNPDRLDEGAATLRDELAAPTGTGSRNAPTGDGPTGTIHTGTIHTGTVRAGTIHTGTIHTGTIHTGTIHTKVCDVTDESSVSAACAVAAGLGRFTMVVANAGFGGAAPIHLTSLEEWNAILATNLTGAFLTIKHAVPHLAASARAGGGDPPSGSAIVAVSSIAAARTHRYMTPYDVSKAGLDMLIRQTADECGGVGIRANSVRPGLVPTDASQTLMTVPQIHDDYLTQIPLGRVGSTEEVGRLVRFLLGPESAWITGTCISVDGGHHLRRGPDLTPVMKMLLGDALSP